MRYTAVHCFPSYISHLYNKDSSIKIIDNIWIKHLKKKQKNIWGEFFFSELLIKTCLILKDMLNMVIKG